MKLLREPQYTKKSLTPYGSIIEPVIDKITTLPNFGLSPPKGHNFKRLRDSPDNSIRTPKRHQFINEEISLVPGWQTPNTPPFQSTIPSPPKETPQNKLTQIMRNMTKPPTPIDKIKIQKKSKNCAKPLKPNRCNTAWYITMEKTKYSEQLEGCQKQKSCQRTSNTLYYCQRTPSSRKS